MFARTKLSNNRSVKKSDRHDGTGSRGQGAAFSGLMKHRRVGMLHDGDVGEVWWVWAWAWADLFSLWTLDLWGTS
jgi:hypothetical protein